MTKDFKLAHKFLKESGILAFSEEFSCLNLSPIKRANEEWQKLQSEKELVLVALEEVLNSSKLVNIRRAVQLHGEQFELNKFEIALLTPHRRYFQYKKFFKKLADAHIKTRFQKLKIWLKILWSDFFLLITIDISLEIFI